MLEPVPPVFNLVRFYGCTRRNGTFHCVLEVPIKLLNIQVSGLITELNFIFLNNLKFPCFLKNIRILEFLPRLLLLA